MRLSRPHFTESQEWNLEPWGLFSASKISEPCKISMNEVLADGFCKFSSSSLVLPQSFGY